MTNNVAQCSAAFTVLNIPELLELIILEAAKTELYSSGVTSFFALQRVNRMFRESILCSSKLQGSKLCLRRTNAATGLHTEYTALDWYLAQTGIWRTSWTAKNGGARKITLLFDNEAATPDWMKVDNLASWRLVPSLTGKRQALRIRTYRYVEGEVQHVGDCIFEDDVALGVLQDRLGELQSLAGSAELDDCSVKVSSVYHAW